MSKGRFVSLRWLASEPYQRALRPLASTPDGRLSGVRPTLRDEGHSGAASGRAREQREPRKRRRDANTRWPKGRGRPFRGRGTTVEQEARWPAKVRSSEGYGPQRGGNPSGVIREPAVLFTWRGTEYRSRRACAGVGSGLVPQCFRRPSVGGHLRDDEESGKLNADNNFDALHRGWRGTRATCIANSCPPTLAIAHCSNKGPSKRAGYSAMHPDLTEYSIPMPSHSTTTQNGCFESPRNAYHNIHPNSATDDKLKLMFQNPPIYSIVRHPRVGPNLASSAIEPIEIVQSLTRWRTYIVALFPHFFPDFTRHRQGIQFSFHSAYVCDVHDNQNVE